MSSWVWHRIMTVSLGVLFGAFAAGARVLAQVPPAMPTPPTPARPTLDEVRRAMAIPSHHDIRGRIDSTGFALHPAQMAKVWELSACPPGPDSLSRGEQIGRAHV